MVLQKIILNAYLEIAYHFLKKRWAVRLTQLTQFAAPVINLKTIRYLRKMQKRLKFLPKLTKLSKIIEIRYFDILRSFQRHCRSLCMYSTSATDDDAHLINVSASLQRATAKLVAAQVIRRIGGKNGHPRIIPVFICWSTISKFHDYK